jgi:hypothetical protein
MHRVLAAHRASDIATFFLVVKVALQLAAAVVVVAPAHPRALCSH